MKDPPVNLLAKHADLQTKKQKPSGTFFHTLQAWHVTRVSGTTRRKQRTFFTRLAYVFLSSSQFCFLLTAFTVEAVQVVTEESFLLDRAEDSLGLSAFQAAAFISPSKSCSV